MENGKQGTDPFPAPAQQLAIEVERGCQLRARSSTGLPCVTRTAVNSLEPSLGQFWTLERERGNGGQFASVDGIAGRPEMVCRAPLKVPIEETESKTPRQTIARYKISPGATMSEWQKKSICYDSRHAIHNNPGDEKLNPHATQCRPLSSPKFPGLGSQIIVLYQNGHTGPRILR